MEAFHRALLPGRATGAAVAPVAASPTMPSTLSSAASWSSSSSIARSSPAGFSGRSLIHPARVAAPARARAIAVPRPSRDGEQYGRAGGNSGHSDDDISPTSTINSSSSSSSSSSARATSAAAAAPFRTEDDDDEYEDKTNDNNISSDDLSLFSEGVDLVLSSGFLAFANHAGFLQAVDDAGLPVRGIMGTSAGALAGSLYAAGLSPARLSEELRRVAPVKYLRPSLRPWRGIASLDGVIERLRDLLPATFEELDVEFAVGVVDASTGRHVVVDSGPLPEAVAASAAIPCVFAPLSIPGRSGGPFADGGVVDRTGLSAWRARRERQREEGGGGAGERERRQQWRNIASSSSSSAAALPAAARRQQQELAFPSLSSSSAFASSSSPSSSAHPAALVHLIHRSSQLSGNDDLPEGRGDVLVVRSPRAGVSFFSLGDFDGQLAAARERAAPVVAVAAEAAAASAASSMSSSEPLSL